MFENYKMINIGIFYCFKDLFEVERGKEFKVIICRLGCSIMGCGRLGRWMGKCKYDLYLGNNLVVMVKYEGKKL